LPSKRVTPTRVATIVEGMSLQALLREYGITRPIELARVLGVDRRYASMLWTGKRRLGAKLAMRLWKEKQIPLDKLLEEGVEAVPTPRGRPPKHPPGEGG
jgi:transcriptional regulator with XRE-family HTH domain